MSPTSTPRTGSRNGPAAIAITNSAETSFDDEGEGFLSGLATKSTYRPAPSAS